VFIPGLFEAAPLTVNVRFSLIIHVLEFWLCCLTLAANVNVEGSTTIPGTSRCIAFCSELTNWDWDEFEESRTTLAFERVVAFS